MYRLKERVRSKMEFVSIFKIEQLKEADQQNSFIAKFTTNQNTNVDSKMKERY